MPDLLPTLAERNTLYLTDLAATFESEARGLEALPQSRRLRRAEVAARAMGRQAAEAADITAGWLADATAALRDGVSGETFRRTARGGAMLLRASLAITQLAGEMWGRAEALGASAAEVAAGRSDVSAARERMLAARPAIDRLAALAFAPPPDLDPAAVARGAEQIRRGEYLTAEQARQAVRRSG